MKKLLFIYISILCLEAQDTTLSKSIYLGWARGANVGGVVGIGLEKEIVKDLSLSFAVGSIHPVLKEETSFSKFDFDIGVKYYLRPWIFLGVNYGFLEYHYESIETEDYFASQDSYFRGFSFSLGLKTMLFENINLKGFLGLSQKKKRPKSFDDMRESILKEYDDIPPITIGLLLGYNF